MSQGNEAELHSYCVMLWRVTQKIYQDAGTRPFNLQEFKQRFPDTEAKKNGLTVLYVPESITSKNVAMAQKKSKKTCSIKIFGLTLWSETRPLPQSMIQEAPWSE